MVVPYPAGIAPDIVTRMVAQSLSQRLGQQFIVDDRPGGASNVGTEIVAHAAPDGYTLLTATMTNAINVSLYDNLDFDFLRDIAPVSGLVLLPLVLVVNPSLPAQDASRVHRLREGQSRQDQLCVGRQRRRDQCGRRIVQA